ncbi:M20/M25/M40 family metallo-hydrolase [Glaciibacter flavus]|nr:M20/M25/M40 family metallo-hydrolase [Glaciibacter flavus]
MDIEGGPLNRAMDDGVADDGAIAADVVDLLAALVRIDSGNVRLGGPGNSVLAELLACRLEESGFDVRTIGEDALQPSVIAIRRGTGGGRTLLINGHLDTVPVSGSAGDGLEPRVEAGRLHGRGSYDMKSGIAAAVVAAERAESTAGDVILTLVADEEFGSTGTEDVLRALRHEAIDGGVVVEPTDLQLTVAHRGFAWFRLEVQGRAAHGSQPELGVDAIAGTVHLLDAVRALGDTLAGRSAHPLLGFSTVRVSTIEGGTDAATIADHCTVTLERRTLPGETPHAVRAELESVLASAAERLGVTWLLEELVSRSALDTAPGPLEDAVSRAFTAVMGEAPVRRGDPWWTDAGLIAEAGIPVLVLGAAGGGAHAADEWVDIESVASLTAVLQRLVADFCGAKMEGDEELP